MNKSASTRAIRGQSSRAIVALGAAVAVSASAVFAVPTASAQENPDGGSSETSDFSSLDLDGLGSSSADQSTVDELKDESAAQGLPETCLPAGLLVGLPLALLLPVGLSSQLAVPGMVGLSSEVDQAIQEANTAIQQNFGIFDEELARVAAAFNIDLTPFLAAGSSITGSAATAAAAAAGLAVLVAACLPEAGGSSFDPSKGFISIGVGGEIAGETTTTQTTPEPTTTPESTTTPVPSPSESTTTPVPSPSESTTTPVPSTSQTVDNIIN